MTQPFDPRTMFDTRAFDMFAKGNPMTDMFRTVTAFNARLAGIAIETAERNADLAHGWTRETLDRMAPLADTSATPGEAAKRMGEFATDRMRAAPEHMARFAEVAKTAQTRGIEAMMDAGREMQGEIVSATREAADRAGETMSKAADAAQHQG